MNSSRENFRVSFQAPGGSFAVYHVENKGPVQLLSIDTGVRVGWAKFLADGRIHSFGMDALNRDGTKGILAQAHSRMTHLLGDNCPESIAKEKGFAGRAGFNPEGLHIEGAILAAIEDWPTIPMVEIHQSTALKEVTGQGVHYTGKMKRNKKGVMVRQQVKAAAKDRLVRTWVEDELGIPSCLGIHSEKLQTIPQDPIDAMFVGLAWFKVHRVGV